MDSDQTAGSGAGFVEGVLGDHPDRPELIHAVGIQDGALEEGSSQGA
jgi:hypothetical protein